MVKGKKSTKKAPVSRVMKQPKVTKQPKVIRKTVERVIYAKPPVKKRPNKETVEPKEKKEKKFKQDYESQFKILEKYKAIKEEEPRRNPSWSRLGFATLAQAAPIAAGIGAAGYIHGRPGIRASLRYYANLLIPQSIRDEMSRGIIEGPQVEGPQVEGTQVEGMQGTQLEGTQVEAEELPIDTDISMGEASPLSYTTAPSPTDTIMNDYRVDTEIENNAGAPQTRLKIVRKQHQALRPPLRFDLFEGNVRKLERRKNM